MHDAEGLNLVAHSHRVVRAYCISSCEVQAWRVLLYCTKSPFCAGLAREVLLMIRTRNFYPPNESILFYYAPVAAIARKPQGELSTEVENSPMKWIGRRQLMVISKIDAELIESMRNIVNSRKSVTSTESI